MKRKFLANFIAILAGVLILLMPGAASAASSVSGNGLKISPVRDSLTINPGSSATIDITIQNITSAPTNLETIINDFKAENETGQPDIILNQNQYATSHSLKQFVQSVPNFSLQPGEQKDVTITITVPAGTGGGGYYGVVRFLPVGTSDSSRQVNVAASVGTLVLLKVPGNLNENLQLASFGVSQNGGPNGSFFTSGSNLSVVTRFQNFGNIQEAPFGKIILKKSGKQIASYEINSGQDPGNVLPGSTRRFSQSLKNLGWGKYTVEGNFGYGSKGTLLSSEQTFYVVPLWLIIVVVVLIILIIIGIILGRKELKRHDRRLLANYRRASRRPGKR